MIFLYADEAPTYTPGYSDSTTYNAQMYDKFFVPATFLQKNRLN